MNKKCSNTKGKLEGTKRSPECPKQSSKEENACIAIIINGRVENDNNDTNKDENGTNSSSNNNNNSDNNDTKKKGKTSIGKIKRYIVIFLPLLYFLVFSLRSKKP